ncbi:MAG TPA: metallophosphoesterase [Pyrinomonadaceae bacterium]|nr:metallophosphoesterase [Pyrinomonadaceae bacterium]
MTTRRKIWAGAIVLLALVAFVLFTRGPETPTPNPPGTFSFAVLGDAPYDTWEEIKYRHLLESLNAHDLTWVIHVGDIFWRPCTDEHYKESLQQFNSLRHPLVYTPGDNEWADCWESQSGGFKPTERLERIRQIFFVNPTRSLGQNSISLISQAGHEPYGEFVENARWVHKGIVFATLHLVGSRNGMKQFPGRTVRDDEASKRRTEAATVWLRETFIEASTSNAAAVVISFHASPDFDASSDHPDRQPFEPLLSALEEEAERFVRPVLIAHGDDHTYTVDHPLMRSSTQRRLENVTRLEVPGSPQVGWVRVVVTPGADNPFAFEPHVIPRWKFW